MDSIKMLEQIMLNGDDRTKEVMARALSRLKEKQTQEESLGHFNGGSYYPNVHKLI